MIKDQPVAVGSWEVPEFIKARHPEVGHRWAWLSALRLSGDGPEEQGVLLVAVDRERTDAVGKWLTRTDAGNPEVADRTYGELRMLLMARMGQRIACEDGTPVRDKVHVLACVWCGRPWDVHHGDGTPDLVDRESSRAR